MDNFPMTCIVRVANYPVLAPFSSSSSTPTFSTSSSLSSPNASNNSCPAFYQVIYEFGSSIDLLKLQLLSCLIEDHSFAAQGFDESNLVLLDEMGREIDEDEDISYIIFQSGYHSGSPVTIDLLCVKKYEDSLINSSLQCLSTLSPDKSPILQLSRRIVDSTILLCSNCSRKFDQNLLSLQLHLLECISCQGTSLISDVGSTASNHIHASYSYPEQLYLQRKCYNDDSQQQHSNWRQETQEKLKGGGHISRQSFSQRLASGKQTVMVYESYEQQKVAREVIDYAAIKSYLGEYLDGLTSNGEDSAVIQYDVLFMKALLRWFKCDFFKWCNKPACENATCGAPPSNMEGKGVDRPSETESRLGWAGNVEVYECKICRKITRFPRYNNPAYMLKHSRRGRCGEFANAFALICRSLALDTKWVLDFTDHVWVEVYLPSYRRFVHIDPCERAIDTPLMYESGWNKNLSFVLSFSRYGVEDSTPRYSRKLSSVIANRSRFLGELFAKQSIADLNKAMESSFFSSISTTDKRSDYSYVEQLENSSNRNAFFDSLLIGAPFFESLCESEFSIDVLKRRKFSSKRELLGLSFLTKFDLKPEEQMGRISGDAMWKAMRGESGAKVATSTLTSSEVCGINDKNESVNSCSPELGSLKSKIQDASYSRILCHPFSSESYIDAGIITKNGELNVSFSIFSGNFKYSNGINIDISDSFKYGLFKVQLNLDISNGYISVSKNEHSFHLIFQIENPSGTLSIIINDTLGKEISVRTIEGFFDSTFHQSNKNNLKNIIAKLKMRLKGTSQNSDVDSNIEILSSSSSSNASSNIDRFLNISESKFTNDLSNNECNDAISFILYRNKDESLESFLSNNRAKVLELNKVAKLKNGNRIIGFRLDSSTYFSTLISSRLLVPLRSEAVESPSSTVSSQFYLFIEEISALSISKSTAESEKLDGNTNMTDFKSKYHFQLYPVVQDLVKYIFLGGRNHPDSRYFDTTSEISSILSSNNFGLTDRHKKCCYLNSIIVWSSSFVNSIYTKHRIVDSDRVNSDKKFSTLISSLDPYSGSKNDDPKKESIELCEEDLVSSVSLYSGDIVDGISFTVSRHAPKEDTSPSSSVNSFRMGGSGGQLSGKIQIPIDKWRLMGFFGASGGHLHNLGVVIHRVCDDEDLDDKREESDASNKGEYTADSSNEKSASTNNISIKEGGSGLPSKHESDSQSKLHTHDFLWKIVDSWGELSDSLIKKNTPSIVTSCCLPKSLNLSSDLTQNKKVINFSSGLFIDLCNNIISSNGDLIFTKIIRVIHQYHQNICGNYSDPKYRKIKVSNAFFKSNLGDYPYAVELLCFGPAEFRWKDSSTQLQSSLVAKTGNDSTRLASEPVLESIISHDPVLKRDIIEYTKLLSNIYEKLK